MPLNLILINASIIASVDAPQKSPTQIMMCAYTVMHRECYLRMHVCVCQRLRLLLWHATGRDIKHPPTSVFVTFGHDINNMTVNARLTFYIE